MAENPEVTDADVASKRSNVSSRPYLKAKFRIGSCKGPKNFPFSETVFHPDDVPANKRENKMKVKKFLHPEKLVGRPDWVIKTTGAMEVYSKRTRINSEFDRSNMFRYNYRAEVLPPKQVRDNNAAATSQRGRVVYKSVSFFWSLC